MQNSLNNSGNKRMLMGRTPSPNFFQKAIAVTPTNNEYAYYKHLQKQGNLTNKNIFKTHISLGYPTKRSQSKQ